jgi:hypothetical protein
MGRKSAIMETEAEMPLSGKKMQINAGHLQATSHLCNHDLIKMPNRL